MKAFKTYRE
jgi:hypothetical protein